MAKTNKMRARTKKGIIDGINEAFYRNWKNGFKPQSQRIIWILTVSAILFGLAVIAWYVLVRF